MCETCLQCATQHTYKPKEKNFETCQTTASPHQRNQSTPNALPLNARITMIAKTQCTLHEMMEAKERKREKGIESGCHQNDGRYTRTCHTYVHMLKAFSTKFSVLYMYSTMSQECL